MFTVGCLRDYFHAYVAVSVIWPRSRGEYAWISHPAGSAFALASHVGATLRALRPLCGVKVPDLLPFAEPK